MPANAETTAETTAEATAGFDLGHYLARIGWTAPPRPDAATLRGLNRAHLHAVPFENLDALGGAAPSLALPDLVAKLLDSRRGGYCYEHNTLYAAALETIGFRVTRLVARVVVGAETLESRPRTHMALLVRVPGEEHPYLADVGFGAAGSLLEAVPLVPGTEFASGRRRHRLVHAPHDGPLALWVLQHRDAGAETWENQYAFTVEPFERPDYEMINWHVATNPRSPFSHRLYLQRTAEEMHRVLDGRWLTETHADGRVVVRELSTEEEARRVVAEGFGIDAPEGLKLLP
ncbi:arylamine N-acetyltransferase [Streptomyces sp. NPDC005805]|uniref:arylamine N-acetyltransferase family protein n=1 Tax=Streptomyces sp. NPDC005805 TaxID=3157068 RepID=UPI0033E5B078